MNARRPGDHHGKNCHLPKTENSALCLPAAQFARSAPHDDEGKRQVDAERE